MFQFQLVPFLTSQVCPCSVTYKCVPLDELGPVHVEPAQLLRQAPAGLRVCRLDQEVAHLVQVRLSGAPLSDRLRRHLETPKQE